MRFFFEEFDDGGGGNAEVDGDGSGIASQGLEEVEDEAERGGVEGMAIGGFDAGLAADGEEPVGGFELGEIDRFAEVGGELEAETANGAQLVFGEGARFCCRHGNAGGHVREANGVGGFVALLSTRTGAARDVEAAIGEELVIGEEAQGVHRSPSRGN